MDRSGYRRTLALLSAGLDSYILWRLAYEPVPIYFDTGLPNNERERALLDRIPGCRRRLTTVKATWLGESVEATGFIPWRNLVFFIRASTIFDEPVRIMIGQTLEWQVDKNARFYRSVERMARTLGHRELWIDAPFARMTKSQAVRRYLARFGRIGGSHDLAAFTYSCLAGTPEHCGRCSSCVQRYIALQRNGLVCAAGGEDWAMPESGEAVFLFEHRPTWDDYRRVASEQRSLFRLGNLWLYARRAFEAAPVFARSER